MTQRAGEVIEVFALFQTHERRGRLAHRLDDQGNGASLAIEIGDGQGHALAAIPVTDDHEVAGLRRLGDVGRFQFPKIGDRRELLAFDDLEHRCLVGHTSSSIPTVRRAHSQRVLTTAGFVVQARTGTFRVGATCGLPLST